MKLPKQNDNFVLMNVTSQYRFTILVPYYNERENITALENRLGAYLQHCPASPACVLFVNDGSTDGGEELVHEVCGRNKDFYYIDLEGNTGLSGALKAGISVCESEYVGYIDADLQTDPEDFSLLLEHISEYELVLGIRAQRKDGFVKRASSKIANSWRRMMTGDGITDTGCPLKVLQTPYAKELPLFKGMHRFIPALVQMQGGRCLEIPVRHYPRTAGTAKYNLGNRLWGPFVDCFAFRWMRKRYKKIKISAGNL